VSEIHSISRQCVAFERIFHVELFRGGMNRLLLRSFKQDRGPRIDVMFIGVEYLDCRTDFDGLCISDVTGTDVANEINNRCRRIDSDEQSIYELRDAHGVGYVVAKSAGYIEDDGESGQPSGFFMMG
jgi:hypothetical protein